MTKPTLPKWKAEELLYCSDCEIVFTRAKAKRDENEFFGESAGYYCPKCDGKVGEIEEPKK